MNKLASFFPYALTCLLLSLMPIKATAELIYRDQGMVYDTKTNVTWLLDFNYSMTSGYDDDGFMTLNDAKYWAENLVYAGFDDWMLPTITADSDNVFGWLRCHLGFQHISFDCSTLEFAGASVLASLNNSLGNHDYSDFSVANASFLDTNSGQLTSFENYNSMQYWVDIECVPEPDRTPEQNLQCLNATIEKHRHSNSKLLVTAVRMGDVTTVPEPSTLFLFLAYLFAFRLGRKS